MERSEEMSRRELVLRGGAVAAAGLAVAPVDVRGHGQAGPLRLYDLTPSLHWNRDDLAQRRAIWDHAHFVASLQGNVNRTAPRLYVLYVGGEDGAIDRDWLRRFRQPGEWWHGRPIERIWDLPALVRTFRRSIRGLVVYDEKVAATSNVASTVAGAEGLACVRFDPAPGSLYRWLTTDADGPRLPVRAWLVNRDGSSLFTGRGTVPGTDLPSSGSAKCDAYLWAKVRYLDTGRSNPRNLAYYLDAYWLRSPGGYIPNHTLSNHDYFIANRAFFFDLSPWDDDAPVDDPDQPLGTDFRTLQAILRSCWERTRGEQMIHAGGFLPWDKKYTNHPGAGGRHEPVPGEWRYAEILSCFNAYIDADALGLGAMANASAFQHFRLRNHYPQRLPTVDDLRSKGFVLPDGSVAPRTFVTIYVGDYDSAAWLYQTLGRNWDDPARGSVTLGWAFNPNLAQRFPAGMDYARRHASPRDHFVSGNSGAGYVNPGYLVPPRRWSGLPSGLAAWERHCREWFRRFNLSLVGFVIDGYAPPMTAEVLDAYARFSPSGIIGQKVPRLGMHGDMPILRMEHDVYSVEQAKQVLLSRAGRRTPEFFAYRNILWAPTSQKQWVDAVRADPAGATVEFVDPYTLLLLVRQFHQSGQRQVPLRVGLWGDSSGAEVTGHSPLVPGHHIRDLFGAAHGTVENATVLFEDGQPGGFVHWVEWRTPDAVLLARFRLAARGDTPANPRNREFARFRLLGRERPTEPWRTLDEWSPETSYSRGDGDPQPVVRDTALAEPVRARYFRAEFTQAEGVAGPRVIELEGLPPGGG
ncbi:MAG TPA: hypothetical protein VLH79_12870 [Chthonomonadales bacterium]|nr:hypothetical protein [Chthonomonadales bacterium]